MKFKFNLSVIAALVVMVGVLYFAFTALQKEAYTGAEITFTNNGIITVDNSTTDPVALRATSRRVFTITSTDPANTTLRAVREGSGTAVLQVVETELPLGTTELRLTRGSEVTYEFTATGPISTSIARYSPTARRNIVIGTGIICLALLFFMSQSTNHAWLNMVRQRLGNKGQAGEVSKSSA